MTTKEAAKADPSARFDQIEALLHAYPNVSDEQVAELKLWFRKQASAFDVASLASKNPAGYERFRKDHIDRFSKVDLVLIVLVVAAVAAGLISLL